MDEVDGATGTLYLDYDGQVHRRLAWAQFQSGEPVALPEPEPIGGPIQDMSEQGELLPPEEASGETWFEPLED